MVTGINHVAKVIPCCHIRNDDISYVSYFLWHIYMFISINSGEKEKWKQIRNGLKKICHIATDAPARHTSRAYPGMLQLEHRWAWQRSDKILLLLPCFPFCVNRRARGRMPPQRACRWICAMLQILYGIIRWCGNFEASLFINEQTCFRHFFSYIFAYNHIIL